MKITYAHRRSAFYPFDDHGGPGNELPPPDSRVPWLAAVRARGFEGRAAATSDRAAASVKETQLQPA